MLELESLGLVHRHDVESRRATRRHSLEVEQRLQRSDVVQRTVPLVPGEHVEEAVDVVDREPVRQDRRTAEPEPAVLDKIAQRQRRARSCQALERREGREHCRPTVCRQARDPLLVAQQLGHSGIALTGDQCVQVAPPEANPGRT